MEFKLNETDVEMGAVVDVAAEMRSKIATDLARGRDGVLGAAISTALGEPWKVEDMIGRLRSERVKGETFETIFLDGEPLLELHDPVFEHRPDGIDIRTPFRVLRNQK